MPPKSGGYSSSRERLIIRPFCSQHLVAYNKRSSEPLKDEYTLTSMKNALLKVNNAKHV